MKWGITVIRQVNQAKKNIEKLSELSPTIEKMGLIDLCRIFHPTAGYTFFSVVQGIISKIECILAIKHI